MPAATAPQPARQRSSAPRGDSHTPDLDPQRRGPCGATRAAPRLAERAKGTPGWLRASSAALGRRAYSRRP
eukprot:7361570-Prymnesium_polylepis.1